MQSTLYDCWHSFKLQKNSFSFENVDCGYFLGGRDKNTCVIDCVSIIFSSFSSFLILFFYTEGTQHPIAEMVPHKYYPG